MNTSNLTTLSWLQLMNPKLIGEEILISYSNPMRHSKTSSVMDIYDQSVTVLGSAYVGNEHVLLVYDKYKDDIFIILRDGQGILWDAYKNI